LKFLDFKIILFRFFYSNLLTHSSMSLKLIRIRAKGTLFDFQSLFSHLVRGKTKKIIIFPIQLVT
jgi:hypothetical protein